MLEKLIRGEYRRIAALVDRSALMLILPALAVLWWIDPPMVKTLVQWSLFFLVLSGVAVMISRVVFPNLDLAAYVRRAFEGPVAASIVAAAVILFVAAVILAMTLWARPAGA